MDDENTAHIWQRCAALIHLPAELPNASGPPHHQQCRIQGRPHHIQRPGLQDALRLQAGATCDCASSKGWLLWHTSWRSCGCFWATSELVAHCTGLLQTYRVLDVGCTLSAGCRPLIRHAAAKAVSECGALLHNCESMEHAVVRKLCTYHDCSRSSSSGRSSDPDRPQVF